MTLPNVLTGVRILLMPVFIIFLVQNELTSALIVFVFAGITDGLDGFFARRYGQMSSLGAYLDPIADKLLLTSAYLILTIKELVPPWLCVLVIIRDLLIILGVAIIFLLQKKSNRIGPSKLSKINTCLQIICVVLVLGKSIYNLEYVYYQFFFWLTAFFTVSSGVHYLFQWLNYLGSIGEDQ
ncbi:MAG: CDP-diacylglycerol--glycerol-3-phosphate 3-phosphatidyltransferase [Desulfatiglandales bacterium]